ncbi:MAG: PIN domain-containing protein [Actinobacteria bacterium]|nr:PIN domain-containing protein [Actinomycetota bacterium]
MPLLVAALDADVLVPILSCDFLLTAFDLGVYEPVVSNRALVEVERNLRADFPQLDPARLSRRMDQMRRALDVQIIELDSFDGAPETINSKDRHVIAAALAGAASILVTNDKRLRAETDAGHLDLRAMSADEFADHLWQRAPLRIAEVIDALVGKRTKRPVTAEELVEALRDPFPTMATAWFDNRDSRD